MRTNSKVPNVRWDRKKKSYVYDYSNFPNGKRERHREFFGCDKKKAEVRALTHEAERRIIKDREKGLESSPCPVELFVNKNLAFYETKSAGTYRVAQQRFDMFQRFCKEQGILFADDFTEAKWERFKAFLPKAKKSKTRNNYLSQLQSSMKRSVKKWEILRQNPLKDVDFETVKRFNKRAFTTQEITLILSKLTGHYKVLFQIALYTAMRLGEICKLCWEHINWDLNQIYIPPTKNDEPGYIGINPQLRRILLDLPHYDNTPYVLIDSKGKPLGEYRHTKNLTKYFWKLFKTLKIEGVSFHTTRHTVASFMKMAGKSNFEVQCFLRHKTAAMTDRYSHYTPGFLQQVVADLDFSQVST